MTYIIFSMYDIKPKTTSYLCYWQGGMPDIVIVK